MPRHFIPDSIVSVTRNGKIYNDTVWHKVPDFKLTTQLGQQVSMKDAPGKIIVADFFFTHCPTICPTMTRAMKLLQNGIKSNERVGNREATFVQFMSLSVDPERDSVPQLKKWNDAFQINPSDWWLLTGSKKDIYDFSNKELRLIAVDGAHVDSNFIHTDMFVLLDTNRYIRGYYHVLLPDRSIDTATLARLSQDIVVLSLEKDPKAKSFLAGKLELIAIVFGVAIIGVIILAVYLNKDKKRNEAREERS
jgi:protein SCO1/2